MRVFKSPAGRLQDEPAMGMGCGLWVIEPACRRHFCVVGGFKVDTICCCVGQSTGLWYCSCILEVHTDGWELHNLQPCGSDAPTRGNTLKICGRREKHC